MNKAFCRKRTIFSLLLTGCLILFNLSCGLDTFYVIDGPTNVIHKPDCSSIDYSENYFDFFTADKEYDNIRFLGTEVYYKIYKSSTRLNTEADDMILIANKSDNTTAAAERMIQSYKFQALRGAGHKGDNILIPSFTILHISLGIETALITLANLSAKSSSLIPPFEIQPFALVQR